MQRHAKESKTGKEDRPTRTSTVTAQKVILFDEEDRDNMQDPHHDGIVVPSTYHQCVKLPIPWGVVKIDSDQQEAKDCYSSSMKASAKTRQAYQLKKQVRDVLEAKEQDVNEISPSKEDPNAKMLV
ncbi:hypothetical protein L1987_01799 [Smallanthus sonchifolius]|uniref:Uncharacterized protein n=1 Tax=Smallanthus sonchifolius TaxID=185202 RepID=A0ACB9K5Y4_9ASTR|nr:hypothetical protein L1987_01799 [Smallanthus sonchifolius]